MDKVIYNQQTVRKRRQGDWREAGGKIFHPILR